MKSESNSLLGLYLEFSSSNEEINSVLLAPEGANHLSSKFSNVIKTSPLENRANSLGWVVQESTIMMVGNKLTGIGVVCYWPEGLKASSKVSSDYYAVLGHISIKSSVQSQQFPPSDSWLVESQYIKWATVSESSMTVSVKITWKLENGDGSLFPSCNIYAEKMPTTVVPGQGPARDFLGVARVGAFYVSDYAVPSDISGVKFTIQVCGVDGSVQKLGDSPFLQLDKPKDLLTTPIPEV